MTSEQVNGILEWLKEPSNVVLAVIGAFVVIAILTALLDEPIKRYPWLFRYGAVVVLAALGGLLTNILYFWAFLLGALNAFTEIVSKFRDEPIKAFGTGSALVYHVVNGVISAFAVLLLIVSGTPVDTPVGGYSDRTDGRLRLNAGHALATLLGAGRERGSFRGAGTVHQDFSALSRGRSAETARSRGFSWSKK